MALPQHSAPAAGTALPAGDPTAVFGRRVVAAVVDGLIVSVPGIAYATSQFEYLEVDDLGMSGEAFCDRFLDEEGGFCINTEDLDDRVYFTDADFGASSLLLWGLALVMFVLLQGLTGWTIGKLLTGIRTVREDGRIVGIPKALVRALLWVVDGQPCGIPLVGFITALTTKGHRRVGDMAAKTFVVRASAAGAPIVVPGVTAPEGVAYGYTGPGWAPPTSPPAPPGSPAAAPSAPTPAPTASGPQWDPARNTYIQWDPTQRRWLQWDEPTRQWTPI